MSKAQPWKETAGTEGSKLRDTGSACRQERNLQDMRCSSWPYGTWRARKEQILLDGVFWTRS